MLPTTIPAICPPERPPSVSPPGNSLVGSRPLDDAVRDSRISKSGLSKPPPLRLRLRRAALPLAANLVSDVRRDEVYLLLRVIQEPDRAVPVLPPEVEVVHAPLLRRVAHVRQGEGAADDEHLGEGGGDGAGEAVVGELARAGVGGVELDPGEGGEGEDVDVVEAGRRAVRGGAAVEVAGLFSFCPNSFCI